MDWENKFASIVKETEFNLDRARQRLHNTSSALSSSMHNMAPYRHDMTVASTGVVPSTSESYFISPRSEVPSTARTHQDQSILSDDDVTFSRDVGRLDNSPAVLLLLVDKLDQQKQEMSAMRKEMQQMTEERQSLTRQVQRLQEEVRHLSNYTNDTHSQQLEHGQRKFQSQLDELRHQVLRTQKELSSTKYDTQKENLLTDLLETRRQMATEYGELRQCLDDVRHRLTSLEGDITYGSSLNATLKKRQDNLDQFMRKHTKVLAKVTATLDDSQQGHMSRPQSGDYQLGHRPVEHKVQRNMGDLSFDLPNTTVASEDKGYPDYIAEHHFTNPKHAKTKTKNTPSYHQARPQYTKPQPASNNRIPSWLRSDSELDDLGSLDLDDVKTTASDDLDLFFDELDHNDLDLTDQELSIDDLQ